ncbi:hypothetical protein [Leekyejoonella antrihumi]|uniref:Uncharacterized protein n=1 Tax=Leekyejoonella antrihumi TaxID=1660198 RepID=A0A563E9H3_9MICO|nr:hypothetical protein [Leekyejoonella antrihumi]TWP38871.1 hypothetical protein FGL98_00205 [Leekyejoonella antrihumi]
MPHPLFWMQPMAMQHEPSITTGRTQGARLAGQIAITHSGVVHRADLRAVGITRDDGRTEVRARRWARAGRRTVVIDGRTPTGEGAWWWAVWESGSGAVLDGVAALTAAGRSGFGVVRLDVTVPRTNTAHQQLESVSIAVGTSARLPGQGFRELVPRRRRSVRCSGRPAIARPHC